MPFLVVGNYDKTYGDFLLDRYKNYPQIRFLSSIYNIEILDNLRYFSHLYFHGHTVGGTNPSLLEAMGSSCTICAHKNVFNETILDEDAYYFSNVNDVASLLSTKGPNIDFVERNKNKIRTLYTWNNIITQYENFFQNILVAKSGKKK